MEKPKGYTRIGNFSNVSLGNLIELIVDGEKVELGYLGNETRISYTPLKVGDSIIPVALRVVLSTLEFTEDNLRRIANLSGKHIQVTGYGAQKEEPRIKIDIWQSANPEVTMIFADDRWSVQEVTLDAQYDSLHPYSPYGWIEMLETE